MEVVVLKAVVVLDAEVEEAQPSEVYPTVTFLLPAVSHCSVTVLLEVPTPPDIIL